jgi:hypothetical protein
MAGLVPAISASDALSGIEIPGTRPGMTVDLVGTYRTSPTVTPPAAVASHAAPQAFASSRTRNM